MRDNPDLIRFYQREEYLEQRKRAFWKRFWLCAAVVAIAAIIHVFER